VQQQLRRYGVNKIEPQSFAAVIRAYLASPNFAKLALSTRQGYSTYLKIAEMPEILGALPVTVIRPALVQKFLDGLAERPGAQQRARVALKAVEAFALPRDLLFGPITLGTTIIGSDGGHQPWTDEQVSIAERFARPEIARIITLGANTGQRGSDLCRMRWSDIEQIDGRPGINVIQRKTGLRIWIPFTQALQHAMATWERRPTQILLAPHGKPYSNRRALTLAWTRERDENQQLYPCAGLVLHGLRATAVVRLRRAGATTPQIVDMVGLSAGMVERYSRFADQRQNALAAVVHLDRTANKTEQEQRKGIKEPGANH
jgi:integrase